MKTMSETFSVAARIALVTLMFVGPVYGVALAKENAGSKVSGAGLVLMVNLQKAG